MNDTLRFRRSRLIARPEKEKEEEQQENNHWKIRIIMQVIIAEKPSVAREIAAMSKL